uniref:ZP domain-containing protein n=1 Tax=Heterorhabditis bacteriophora TaxID=37862 RepID=A0A1I7XUR8_HETBA
MIRLIFILPFIYAIEFDTVLTEKPLIECGHGQISIRIEPTQGVPSHIFAKGHFHDEECSFRNSSHVVFDFDKCGVNKRREINPRGMSFSMTVVVQIHPLFITKVDRSYKVRCEYMEAEKTDSANGPLVKLARVGEVIYHVWDCPSDIFGVLVHTCSILDGQGNEYKVIDEQGCTTDSNLMPELSYAKDLTRTFTASYAFNFPDQPSAYFNCQLKLCHKYDNGCASITPPRCGENPLSGQDDSLANDLDNDQLITTTASGFSKQATITTTPTTTTTIPSTTKVVATTVTEVSTTTTSAPTTTIVMLPEDFPTPKTLREFLEKKFNDTKIEEEELQGSVAEIPEALRAEPTLLNRNAVCIPLVGFWLLGALSIICFGIIVASLCYAQRQREKFSIIH